MALQAAHELAERFEDGVVFVGLAALRNPELVPDEIAGALGVEARERAPLDEVARHLHDRSALLVLENFEQVDEAAPALSTLLAEAAQLKLLVTSRHRLDLYGEHEYAVPPLRLEDEAVPLFVARARAAGAEVAAQEGVRHLCRALDCLPLGIELAAGRLRNCPLESLVETLPRRLQLATSGPRDAPERQRTLTAAIAWSYELLDERQQRLFQDLSVFAGGFDADATESVCEEGAEESLQLYRELEDVHETSRVLVLLGTLADAHEEHARAISLLEESVDLARETEDSVALAFATSNLANVALELESK